MGYTTIEVPMGYAILSFPFQDLAEASEEGFPIQKVTGNLVGLDNELVANSLLVLNPETKQYTTYYYKTAGWVKDGEAEPTQDMIAPGASVFIRKNLTAGTVSVAGKVITDETYTVSLPVGVNLVANPYPVAIKISELKGALTAHDNALIADEILLMDPQTKEYISYQNRASSGWTKKGETDTTTDVIEAGRGFFYRKMLSAGSLTFTNPL